MRPGSQIKVQAGWKPDKSTEADRKLAKSPGGSKARHKSRDRKPDEGPEADGKPDKNPG